MATQQPTQRHWVYIGRELVSEHPLVYLYVDAMSDWTG